MAEQKATKIGRPFKDLSGKRFGMLTAAALASRVNRTTYWQCICDCGNTKIANAGALKKGTTASCGCLRSGRPINDITGVRSGRLVAVSLVRSDRGGARWNCICDCGSTAVVNGTLIATQRQHSCGCWTTERIRPHIVKHGMYKTSEYGAWHNAKDRCFNPQCFKYPDYGGRGITMASVFADSFEAFYGHIGPRPEGMTLDRIDNEKGYEPGNVRWATPLQQANNRRHPRPYRKHPH